MRKSMLALALAATCAAPLSAQTIDPTPQLNGAGPVTMGGFAGARIRISLGGTKREDQTIRAGLTIAPMPYRGGGDRGNFRSRIGEGLEFGFRGGAPGPQLSLAGMPLTPAHYAPGGRATGKQRNSMSGGNTGLVIAGVAALVGIGLLVALGDSKDDCTGGECNNN